MKELFSEFSFPTKQDWLDKINIDLKGKDFDSTLINQYEIEDISFWSQHHKSDSSITNQTPGKSPYKRGAKFENNDWIINAVVPVSSPKEMNAFALDFLMKGNTGLRIDLKDFSVKEALQIVEGIDFTFINTSFILHSKDQVEFIQNLYTQFPEAKIDVFSETLQLNQVKGKSILINAANVLNTGGNSSQEIAYALHEGHTQLHKLMEDGLSVDDASAKLKFRFGIGNLYFIETTKLRAFRTLWSFIISQYKPKHECTKTAFVESETIFVNKSLQDPYTNLLRQTTEGMSAVLGGVNELTILPYDFKAEKQKTDFTQRMANNISLLLKEESYLDKVIDPAGGSYALEKITEEIQTKSWNLFQELEQHGIEFLKTQIIITKSKRKDAVLNGTQTLIGINKFPNIEKEENNWLKAEKTPFGETLVLERDCNFKLA